MRDQRVHVVVAAEERAAYRAAAEREGLSLSAWLRAAAEDRRAAPQDDLASVEELDEFFARCDEREQGVEPEWEEHLEVMRRSRLGSA